MKIFNRNKEIIKTNPSDKPSKRYEEVLFSQLEMEGFNHLKSKHEFVQEFEFGKRIISLSYNNSYGYISSVTYHIKIIFNELEKAFKKVYPNYGWTNWTIHQNLHWTNSNLYDDKTNSYSDKSINKLSEEFFKEIKPQIDNTFKSINNYKSLNSIYNSNPTEFFDYLPNGRLEKRIINGLILANNFEFENFEKTKNEYYKLIEIYKGNDIKEIKAEIEEGLNYLNNNKLKLKIF